MPNRVSINSKSRQFLDACGNSARVPSAVRLNYSVAVLVPWRQTVTDFWPYLNADILMRISKKLVFICTPGNFIGVLSFKYVWCFQLQLCHLYIYLVIHEFSVTIVTKIIIL